jgi:SAM-dependent methyltransferase
MRDNYAGETGRERREPSVTERDYLVLSSLSKLLRGSVEKYLTDRDAVILDIGCGEKPYQPFFFGKSSLYIGVDIGKGEQVDVVCQGEMLPFMGNIFSACLCLQVLEHVDWPQRLIGEISRVLKPGGLLLLSTHGNWPFHGSPCDYWRWTHQGLKKLLGDWEICEMCRCNRSAASMIQLLELYIPRGYIGKAVVFILNKLGVFLDNLSLNALLPDLATNYLAVAKRKRGI